jgi:hypothetical protein
MRRQETTPLWTTIGFILGGFLLLLPGAAQLVVGYGFASMVPPEVRANDDYWRIVLGSMFRSSGLWGVVQVVVWLAPGLCMIGLGIYRIRKAVTGRLRDKSHHARAACHADD